MEAAKDMYMSNMALSYPGPFRKVADSASRTEVIPARKALERSSAMSCFRHQVFALRRRSRGPGPTQTEH